MRCVKYWQTALVMFAALCASIAPAEDFKTIQGKEYKNVTISRVETDGIVLKNKSGITKIYFTELPKDVQERFHHDAAQGAHFTDDEQAKVAQQNTAFTDRLGGIADQFASSVWSAKRFAGSRQNFPPVAGSDSSHLCIPRLANSRRVCATGWSCRSNEVLENNQGRYQCHDTGLRIASDHDCEYSTRDNVERNHVQQR